MRTAWLLVALPLLVASRFPPGSSVVDPRDYGAVPNTGLPQTAAFQAAASAAAGVGHIFEITGSPGDEYILDAPIRAQVLHGNPPTLKWTNNWIILCDPGVILRIPDSTPTFGNAAAPQPLFAFGSTSGGAPIAPPASGGGVEAYRNTFDGSCEIHTGHGNPGARGIDWVCNNRGALRDVRILSDDGLGDAGIWAGRPWPGPCLVDGIEVGGFKNGLWDGFTQYGLTIRNAYFHGQSLFAINATADATYLDHVRSVNTVPALRLEFPAGQVTVLDSTFESGSPAKGALQLGALSQALVRDSSATGYGALIKQGSALRTDLGLAQAEWTAHPGFDPFGGPVDSLRLPALEPPRPFDSADPAAWANVRDYGGNPLDTADDRTAILTAIATGKPILQLDQNLGGLSTYYVSDTIDLPCSVKRVEGMESRLITTAAFPSGHPLLRLAAGCDWSDVTTIERVWLGGRFGPMVEHADARTLYLKDGYFAASSTGIHARPGSGRLFMSNVVTKHLQIDGPHEVWAYQLNPEGIGVPAPGVLGIDNGGTLRVVGMKTEGIPTVTTRAGARTEILGAMLMPCVGMGAVDIDGPGFIVEDGGDLSASYTNWCGKNFDLSTWDVQVRETQNGVTHEVLATDLMTYAVEGGNRVFMPLYRSKVQDLCEVP